MTVREIEVRRRARALHEGLRYGLELREFDMRMLSPEIVDFTWGWRMGLQARRWLDTEKSFDAVCVRSFIHGLSLRPLLTEDDDWAYGLGRDARDVVFTDWRKHFGIPKARLVHVA